MLRLDGIGFAQPLSALYAYVELGKSPTTPSTVASDDPAL